MHKNLIENHKESRQLWEHTALLCSPAGVVPTEAPGSMQIVIKIYCRNNLRRQAILNWKWKDNNEHFDGERKLIKENWHVAQREAINGTATK